MLKFAPMAVLPSPVLSGVSSPRRAALPQPVLRCAPRGAAARCEARVHTPGEAGLPGGGAEGAGVKCRLFFLSAHPGAERAA